MFIVLVLVAVKADFLDPFLVATLEMAHAALGEVATRRFEVIRQADDPGQFVLYKATHTPEDTEAFLASAPVKQWLMVVGPMLASAPQVNAFTQLF